MRRPTLTPAFVVRTVLPCVFLLFTTTGCIVIPIGDLLKSPALEEQILQDGGGFFSRDKIVVIELEGVITTGEAAGIFGSRESSVAELRSQLEWAANDPEVHAVVLRVSSPGGEVTAADILHQEVQRFREQTGKPVIASIVDCGASGAYYVATAADVIIAHPTAIVGSIGVILHSFDLSGLLDKIGVAVNPVKSAEKKDLNSIFRRPSTEERAILQKLVDDMYARFVDVVANGRPALTRQEVMQLADGRVVSGEEAAKLKLVDRTGYLGDAIEEACTRTGVESPTVVRYTRRGSFSANIYSQLGSPAPRAAIELDVQTGVWRGPKLYYLWQPGL